VESLGARHATDAAPGTFPQAVRPGSGPETGSRPEPEPSQEPQGGVLGPHFRWITIGMCALVLFVAFEALAVTTVMPVIARDLNGASLYTLAFSGSTAI